MLCFCVLWILPHGVAFFGLHNGPKLGASLEAADWPEIGVYLREDTQCFHANRVILFWSVKIQLDELFTLCSDQLSDDMKFWNLHFIVQLQFCQLVKNLNSVNLVACNVMITWMPEENDRSDVIQCRLNFFQNLLIFVTFMWLNSSSTINSTSSNWPRFTASRSPRFTSLRGQREVKTEARGTRNGRTRG